VFQEYLNEDWNHFVGSYLEQSDQIGHSACSSPGEALMLNLGSSTWTSRTEDLHQLVNAILCCCLDSNSIGMRPYIWFSLQPDWMLMSLSSPRTVLPKPW